MATAVVSLLNVFDDSDSESDQPSVSPSPPLRRPLQTRPPQVSVKHEVVSANLEVVSQDCFAQRLEGISSSCMNCQKERAMTKHPYQGRHKRRRKQVKVNTPIVIKLKDTLKAAIQQKLQANYTNCESKAKYPTHVMPSDTHSDDYPDPGWVKKNKNLTALLSVIEKTHKKNYYNLDSNLSYDSCSSINLQNDHNHQLNNVKYTALSNSFKSKSKQKNIGECDNVDVICNDLTNLSERDTDSPITDSDSVVSTSSDTLSDSETSVGTESSSTFEFSSEELDQLAEWTSGLPLICYDCPPSECPQCLSAWYTSQYYLYDLNTPIIHNENDEFHAEPTDGDSVGTDLGDVESESDYVPGTRNQSTLIIKDGETQTDESDWPYISEYSFTSSNSCSSTNSESVIKPQKPQKQLLEISVQAGKRIQDQACLNTVYIDLSDTDVTFSVVYHHNLPSSTFNTTTTANTIPIVTLTSTPLPTLTTATSASYHHQAPTPLQLTRNVAPGSRFTSPDTVASVHGEPLVSIHPTANNPIISNGNHHKDVFGDMAPYVHSSPLFPFYCYLPPSITYPVAVPGFNAPFTVPKFDSSIPRYLMVPPNELRNFTASTPPQRHWIPLAHPERNRPTTIFTVMCYNVLCDKYCTRQLYGYCPSWALNWEYRKKGIIDEIKQYSADIISLQEVETDQFYNFFLPELKRDGYDGIFSPKSRARTMTEQERKHVDGCAIFFRTNKFALKKKHLIEFNQLAMANAEGSDEMLNRVMTKDNIGLAALLETKEGAYDTGNGMTAENVIRQPLLVATAHIHWDPEYSDVKLIQTMMLMWEFKSIMEDAQKTIQASSSASTPSVSADPTDCNAIPLILCGDLNSLPDSGVVEYISSGKVSPSHCDFKDLDYETCLKRMSVTDPKEGLAHNFRLTRAYSDGIIPYTNYTYDFKGIIDYIFFSEGRMSCLGVLGPLDEEWFKQNKVIGCPHPHISSDHFSLFVELEMPVPFTNGRPVAAASHSKIR